LLNTAVAESEKLMSFNIKAKESIIKSGGYDTSIKLKFLNNHIEESNLESNLKAILLKPEIQNFVVAHQNFSPRSVEYISFSENIESLSPYDFEKFIINNFNNPAEIWRHAYEQQINDIDRFLLNTMVSFGDSVDIEHLEIAFNSRLDYEVKYNNYTRPMHAFRSSFTRLENGFIVQETHDENKFKFINPSLIDFLVNYLRNDRDEVIRISEATIFLKQLTTRFLRLEFTKPLAIPKRLKTKLLNDYSIYIKETTANSDRFSLAILFYYYFNLEETEVLICQMILSVSDWIFLEERDMRYYAASFLEKINSDRIIKTIKEMGLNFVDNLILNENIESSIKLIKMFIEKFDVDLINIFQKDQNYYLSQHFTNLLNDKIDGDVEDLLEYPNAGDFVTEKEIDSKMIKKTLEDFGLDIKANFSNYGTYDWDTIGRDNYFREQMAKDD